MADPSFAAVSAAIMVGTVALMILGVQPILLEALVRAGRLQEAQVGLLATIENLALALGTAIGPPFLRSGAMRLKVALVSLLLVAADLAIYAVNSTSMLLTVRTVAGLLEGMIMAATVVVTMEHSKPDRINALFLGLSAIPQAIMAFALPEWIVPTYGVNGGFALLAILSGLCALSAFLLIDKPRPLARETEKKPVWTIAAIAALLAVGLQNGAIGAAWNHIPLLVDQRHFDVSLIGIAIAGALIFQVIGALAVAAWGRHFPFWPVTFGGGVCQIAIIAALATTTAPTSYIVMSLLFGLFWLALQPFQVRLLIAIDPTRTVATLLAPTIFIGLSLGPVIGGFGVRGADVTGAFWLAAILMASAMTSYGIAAFARSIRL